MNDIIKKIKVDANLPDDIAEIQFTTGKILSEIRMKYDFGIPNLFETKEDVNNQLVRSILNKYI